MKKQQQNWKIARTGTVAMMYTMMEYCQANSISRMFCDRTDIGKTVTAKLYASKNPNVAYVDCSRNKTRHLFVRALAKAFRVDHEGRLNDVLDNLIDHILSLENPIIILDEIGDLDYNAWMETKSIWNALERHCGWFAIGADGLRAKVERLRERKKVGYAEMFRRFGSSFQRVTPKDDAQYAMFFRAHAEAIAKENMPGVPVGELLKVGDNEGSVLSLDRLHDNIIKQQNIRK